MNIKTETTEKASDTIKNVNKVSRTIFDKMRRVASTEREFVNKRFVDVKRKSVALSKPTKPIIKPIARGSKFIGRGIGKGVSGFTKLGINIYKATPKSVKLGGIALGAVAMVGVSMMKGAMNASREIVYDRYMQNAAMNKNVLDSSRLPRGISRMDKYNSTMGLSNSLSKTRHGRI